MNRILFALAVLAACSPLALAQEDTALPPIARQRSINSAPSRAGASRAAATNPDYVPFCPPSRCLYYAGDWGVSDESDANALFNANDTGNGLDGQVWVGIKPDQDVSVTGATVVGFFTAGFSMQNPTPFSVKVGIGPGQFGRTICSTSGNATFTQYGESDGPVTYSFTIQKLSKACNLKKGRVYYVNILPTSDNGYGYVSNLPPKPQNHYGWKNYLNHCYFGGKPPFLDGLAYVPCNSEGSGFGEFQLALTGRRVH